MECAHDTVLFSRCTACEQPVAAVCTGNKPQQLFNIRNYHIPDEVRRRAMELYSRMHVDIKKGTKRKELEYFLVYSAYKEEGIVVEPYGLAKIMGINPASIGKAHSAFSFSSTGYKPPIMIGSPIKLIPELCAKLGTIEVGIVESIVGLARSVISKNAALLEHSPQKLAVAFIESYLEDNSYEVNKQLLCELVNVTDGTLNSVIKVIKNST